MPQYLVPRTSPDNSIRATIDESGAASRLPFRMDQRAFQALKTSN